MSRGTALLLVLIFGLGLGLGYLSGREATGPARSRPSPVASKPDPPSRTLRHAIDSLPAPTPMPVGDGTIEGRVLERSGDPIEGAVVVARLFHEPPRDKRRLAAPPPSVDGDLAAWVREQIRARRQTEAERVEVVTGVDGRFELTGLPNGRFSVSAYAPGYLIRSRPDHAAYAVAVGSEVEFVGTAFVEVPVEIRLEDGSVPEEAEVCYRQANSTQFARWYPHEAWVELRPGYYEVWAQASGGEGPKSESRQITIRENEPPERLSFLLKARRGLRLRVQYPEGFERRELEVALARLPEGAEPDPTMLNFDVPGRPHHLSGNRTWTWMDLPAGRYLIGASWFGQEFDATRVAEVGDGLAECLLVLPAPEPRDYLLLKLGGPAGEQLPGANLQVHSEGEQVSGITKTGRYIRREDGVLFVDDLVSAGEVAREGATYRVVATHRDFGSVEREYRPGTGSITEMRFLEPAFVTVQVQPVPEGMLRGRLWLKLGSPISGRPVILWGRDRDRVNDEGNLRLGPVQPGRYDLRIAHAQTGPTAWVLGNRLVELRSGEQKASMPLPAIHSVTFHCPHGESDDRVALSQLNGEQQSFWIGEELDPNRRVTFVGVFPGRYRVGYPGKAGEWRETSLDLPVPGLLTLE